MKKRNILFAILLALLFSLTGCGGKNMVGSAADTTETNSTQSDSAGKTQEADVGAETQQETPSEVTQENLSSFPTTDETMFTTEAVDGGVSVTSCSDEDSTVIVVPETIGGETVVGISKYAFNQMTMQGVVLPDTIKTVGMGAFATCKNLKYVDLGSGLEEIGMMTFTDCDNLVRVEFPESMVNISSVVLGNCGALEEVVIPGANTECSDGILDAATCPNAVVVTPAGSVAESVCIEYSVPYQNS